MIKNPNMKKLLDSMGLDLSDYSNLVRAGNGTDKRLSLS